MTPRSAEAEAKNPYRYRYRYRYHYRYRYPIKELAYKQAILMLETNFML